MKNKKIPKMYFFNVIVGKMPFFNVSSKWSTFTDMNVPINLFLFDENNSEIPKTFFVRDDRL